MDSKSFRADLRLAPLGFRTPSPPAFEPINPVTPSTAAWSAAWKLPSAQRKPVRRQNNKSNENGVGRRKKKGSGKAVSHDSAGDFTHVAPRNRAAQYKPSSSQGVKGDNLFKRPSKRAKSEHITANEEVQTDSRPHTSYHAQTEVQTADAELLLNFSRTASSEASNAARPAWQMGSIPSPHVSDPRLAHLAAWTNSPRTMTGQTNTIHEPLHETIQPSLEHIGHVDWGKHGSGAIFQLDHSTDGLSASQPVARVANDTIPDPRPNEQAADKRRPLETHDYVLQGITENNSEKTTRENISAELIVQKSDFRAHKFLNGIEEAAIADAATTFPESGISNDPTSFANESSGKPMQKSPSICAGCNFHRNSLAIEGENEGDSWISCDGCKSWFHFACAGFKNEREVRSVDKFRCRQCKSTYGPTTYVRKSARAHSAIDYAGLNEGIVKSSDENPLHHYIKPIKDGTITFDPENFARMRPELVTREYFERGDGMREPIVIPAEFNPRPKPTSNLYADSPESDHQETEGEGDIHDTSVLNDWRGEGFEFEQIEDHGQDALGMVIPVGLTVRKVSELYGPEEKIDVIDVKSQNGEDKKWTMRRWVDYYESTGSKKVRNVISLEVSQSRLGRLIQRPKVVRDLDLQDSVWPAELIAKGDFPKVQFYCLMSVADCYTDFHIDFGGSSVYYHILEGKKTFFFIPPHEKHLKKYEEWCNSPAQNWTFLGDQTKECYRVDLSAGDTMLIPAGWIHAVWTPEDSLVIGGNFLTTLNLPMQIRVTQIEKATFVDRKFRYPYFQKVMWYAALTYLEDDPLPESVAAILASGQPFDREVPTHLDFDGWGENSMAGAENYHSRYYSKAELDGLPELARYLHRTALIAMGSITDGITTKTQEAVKRSIPKGCGDPFQTVKKFAMWYTWKQGNETIPHWAYPDFVPEGGASDLVEKKLSAKALKRLDREAALQAWKIAPDRQSTRVRSQPQSTLTELQADQMAPSTPKQDSTTQQDQVQSENQLLIEDMVTPAPEDPLLSARKSRSDSNTRTWGGRRPACEACRKGRRACKHRDSPFISGIPNQQLDGVTDLQISPSATLNGEDNITPVISGHQDTSPVLGNLLQMDQLEIVQQNGNIGGYISRLAGPNESGTIVQSKTSGRSKACKDCRKSKRRCVHDEFGNEDPIKLAEAAIPRPAAKKRKANGDSVNESSPKRSKKTQSSPTVDTEMEYGNGDIKEEGPSPSTTSQEDVSTHPEAVNDSYHDHIAQLRTAEAQVGAIENENISSDVHAVANSPISEAKFESRVSQSHSDEPSGHHAPMTGSLVSPPESATFTDAEQTPPTNVRKDTTQLGSNSNTLQQPSVPPKAIPRYTPESNAQGQTSVDGEATSPTTSAGTAEFQKRRASRIGSDHETDEESLKLIRQLAAQDMGLRRRAKVV